MDAKRRANREGGSTENWVERFGEHISSIRCDSLFG
jgi:hypothetical protein